MVTARWVSKYLSNIYSSCSLCNLSWDFRVSACRMIDTTFYTSCCTLSSHFLAIYRCSSSSNIGPLQTSFDNIHVPRVIVVCLSVCVSVCLSVCPLIKNLTLSFFSSWKLYHVLSRQWRSNNLQRCAWNCSVVEIHCFLQVWLSCNPPFCMRE